MTPLCVSVAEAAVALGIGRSAVWRYVESGALPVIKFPSAKHDGESSRRVLIAVADLEVFIAKHRTEAR
jgi:predicted DNA-binding transcriptional regulator AlpA